MLSLTPDGEQELIEAIAGSFTPEDLNYKLADPLGVPPDERSFARDYRERVAALVEWSKARDQLAELLATALRGNPSSAKLRRLNEAHGLLPPSSAMFELLNDALPTADRDSWMRRMGETQRQVCEVNVGDTIRATGFLVGLDLVMTAALVVDDERNAGDVRFTF